MALQQIPFSFGDEPPAPPPPGETPPAAEEPATEAAPPEATAPRPDPAAPELFPPEEPLATAQTAELFPPEPEPAPRPAAPPPGELFAWDPALPAPKPKRAPAAKGTRGRKSVKELAAAADLIEIPEDEVLFQKQYYAIGEVAAMFKVNTSLIRYWETEFNDIKPRKNKKGDRFFTPADIKTLELIHFLLRRKKLTIEGAKEYLKAKSQDGNTKLELVRSLEKVKAFLLELKARL
ncbi:MerR family transcriptional regulator [Dinghuibacter silviterrae]|uniref:DNA-binding transcriptional MerR regulator n=1 Tax=Dinghuibacter silviterrae TaxID=1539049 RepID=A0A4R8DN84_9BACT|nr:MerR family transcriptional regulator [Dinghuibacter silviterrae]TDW99481.1 DNA-binding transcriptional MerR regulator [Dinghuibacter silviterrae]